MVLLRCMAEMAQGIELPAVFRLPRADGSRRDPKDEK
jgi:hypothetical protein